jgi:hypothetical protein
MGSETCSFFGWENGISCTGVVFIIKKAKETGNEIDIGAGRPLRRWDVCSLTLGFSQNLGWEMEIVNTLRDPLIFSPLLWGTADRGLYPHFLWSKIR